MEVERRLFYVALTRAKDEFYLITELGSESRFIDEIPKEFYAVNKTEFENYYQSYTNLSTVRYRKHLSNHTHPIHSLK